MDQRSCKKCRKKSFIRDDDTGVLVCTSCGIIQEFDNYDAQIGGINGPEGTYIRVGTAGSGTFYNYKERKILEAQRQIDDFTSRLGFSSAKSDDVKTMISRITDGEFGQGNWFPLLIGACSYVVMRNSSRSLPIAEVAAAIGCDLHELGRMINRVVDFLDLKLPEFDIVSSFERSLRDCSSFREVSKDKRGVMMKQGVFLVQCAVKWFLTTGRRPLPMVAAVLVFVAELNQVGAKIEVVAKEVNAAVATSKKRYKELLKTLVNVAQALPWGKDISVKNIVINAPFVLRYMEMKSMGKKDRKRKDLEGVRFDMEDVVSACLSKEIQYGAYSNVENDSQYFELQTRNRPFDPSVGSSEKLKISLEGLPMAYSKFQDNVCYMKDKRENGENRGRKRGGYEIHGYNDLWTGDSAMSKKLSLNQILEKDVGLDAMPPSFVNGCMANKKRREKIKAAKLRINKITRVTNTDSGSTEKTCSLESAQAGKKRRRRRRPVGDIEWEDFVIETLLLHQVKEEEIEKGHYKTLLDLHVFNSGVM